MKLYLSSVIHDYCNGVLDDLNAYILESFYSVEPRFKGLYHKCKDFLLDSGAFYYSNNNKRTDFESYCDRYIDFINDNGIEKFFELDVDFHDGLKETERFRKRIEQRTGKQVIPVWHVSRGIDYYKSLCKDYKYVAISVTGPGDITKRDYPKLTPMVNYAHSMGTRVHGLGFTSLKYLPIIHFDSVDSSSWSSGRRYRLYWEFNARTGEMKSIKPGRRVKDWREVTRHNYNEWVRFQKHAYSNY